MKNVKSNLIVLMVSNAFVMKFFLATVVIVANQNLKVKNATECVTNNVLMVSSAITITKKMVRVMVSFENAANGRRNLRI